MLGQHSCTGVPSSYRPRYLRADTQANQMATHIHIYIHTLTGQIPGLMYIFIYINICVYTQIPGHICLYTHIFIYMNIYISPGI